MFECKRFISFCFQGYVGFLSGSDELRGRLTNQDLKKLFGNVMGIAVAMFLKMEVAVSRRGN